MRYRPVALVLHALLLPLFLGACALPIATESELESESGKQFQEMRAQIPASTDVRLRSYINCVAAAIVEQLEKPYSEKDWDVEVFDSEDINAFAMPGGRIGIFTGLMQVTENQDQLAAVIGHEVAHVTQQHSLKRVNREATTRVGVIAGTAVLGGGAGVGDVVAMGAQVGLSLPFSRGNETEADTVGLNYMAAAGFNPSESIQLWKNMGKKNKLGPPQWLSTHPSGDSRIQDLIRQLPDALKLYNSAQAAGKKPDCQK
ncbi:MAG: M48 family peptidase [Chromatiales bacterium]|jgi:predicted Zn-dependent protease|nr:MAG: M48 family peptidase [Chromatiales bacterium]